MLLSIPLGIFAQYVKVSISESIVSADKTEIKYPIELSLNTVY